MKDPQPWRTTPLETPDPRVLVFVIEERSGGLWHPVIELHENCLENCLGTKHDGSTTIARAVSRCCWNP